MSLFDSTVDQCIKKVQDKVPYMRLNSDIGKIRKDMIGALTPVSDKLGSLKKMELLKLMNAVTDEYVRSLSVAGTSEGTQASTNVCEKGTQQSLKAIHTSG